MTLTLLKAGFTYHDILGLDETEFNAYFDDIITLHKTPHKGDGTGARAKTYTIEIDDE